MVSLRKLLAVCAFALAGVLMMSAAPVVAQTRSATPAASTDMPVAIHQGTCDQPVAEPAWKTNDASVMTSDTTVGSATNAPVSRATDKIKATLDDLGKEPYVIAVHKSAEDYNTIVACGAIAGPKVDGKVTVPLMAQDGSGMVGIAILEEGNSAVLDLGSDEIGITVYLFSESGPAATPAA